MNPESEPINEKNQEESQIRDEQEYIDFCVEYALSIGWVREKQKDLLVEKYLKPIYQEYLQIIEDLKNDTTPEDELKRIIRKLNICLNATRRIGSTEHNNIIMTVRDLRSDSRSEYDEYAMTSMGEFLVNLLAE